VISQARRDSSIETKIAPRSVRIAACAGRGTSLSIIGSREWVRRQPHSSGAKVASQTPIGSFGSSGRCRGSAAFSPSTRHDARSGGSRPCCGCTRALASPARGRCASRTGFCRSASDFQRPTKRKIGVGTAHCTAYARVCDKPRASAIRKARNQLRRDPRRSRQMGGAAAQLEPLAILAAAAGTEARRARLLRTLTPYRPRRIIVRSGRTRSRGKPILASSSTAYSAGIVRHRATRCGDTLSSSASAGTPPAASGACCSSGGFGRPLRAMPQDTSPAALHPVDQAAMIETDSPRNVASLQYDAA
jgi:hypothetical protein